MKNKLPFLILGVAILLGVVVVVMVAMRTQNHVVILTPPSGSSTVATAAPIGGAFELVDSNGTPVTDRTYAGRDKLVFFGFTHCPSICPGELLKIADILKALGDQANKIVPLFITIDPARDTPDVLRTYIANFDSRIVGLTGTQAQIDHVLGGFKAYAARVPQGDDYTMDHSTFLYLTDHNNHMVQLFRMDDDANTIAARIKTHFNGR